MEATSVLAIAYSKEELDKWLNFQEANNNLVDDYRLGYVAGRGVKSLFLTKAKKGIEKK